jgi:D-alanyl-D-alanine carboxypeptidase
VRILAPLALLVLAASSYADKVDDIVNKAMKDRKIPGVAIMILKDGKPTLTRGYGFANLEHQVRVKPETVFQSGSVGKQFTATLVMMLVEEGKLKLEDPIEKFFPEAKGKWEGVKLRHLLSHTSGLPDMPYHLMDLRKDYKEDDLVKLMVDQKSPEKPGDKWRYNNGGYVMLGILVRRVTGKFYGDLLQEKIFRPLQMSTARIISEPDIVMNRAAGYELRGGQVKNQDWVAPQTNTTADGSLYLSLRDYAKWDSALYTNRLLKDESLRQMWTPVTLNNGDTSSGKDLSSGYGFGWVVHTSKGKRLIDHGGAWQGFATYIGRAVDDKTTVVVLVNLDARNARAEQIGRDVLKLFLPATP